MSLIGSVSLTNKKEGLFLGSVKLDNLNVESNSVLYSSDGVNISGNNQKLKFDETLKQLTINDGLSYTSAYPISLQTSDNEATYYTGVLAQNKNNSDGASTHILITNDLGTDSSNYGGLDMASSNSTVQYGQFGTMKNALGLSSQSSSIVLTPNAGGQEPLNENANIMLTYNGGTKAHIINNNGQLIVGADTPDFTGSTYGGDDGGTDKVLTSNGTSGLKWSSLNLTGFQKQFYYLSTFTPQQQGYSIQISTPEQLSFNIAKKYKITIVYNFDIVSGSIIQCAFAIRDNDSTTLQQVQMNLQKQHQTVTIVFNIQPLIESSYLYFLASSGDQINNSDSDCIIWDIQEIQ